MLGLGLPKLPTASSRRLPPYDDQCATCQSVVYGTTVGSSCHRQWPEQTPRSTNSSLRMRCNNPLFAVVHRAVKPWSVQEMIWRP